MTSVPPSPELADTDRPPAFNPRQAVVDWLEARLGEKAWDRVVLAICEGDRVQWCSRTGIAALVEGGGATNAAALDRGAINPGGKWEPSHDFTRLEAWARANGAWHEPGDGYVPRMADALFVLRHTSTGLQLHYATVAVPHHAGGDLMVTIEGNSHYTPSAPHGQIAVGAQLYTHENVKGCVDVTQLLGAGVVPVEPLSAA